MEVRGAVHVILQGPADKLESALAAIQEAGIYAEKSIRESAIEAVFSDETQQPCSQFRAECAARAAAAAEGTGFTVIDASTMGSNAATRKIPYNRITGERYQGWFIDVAAPLEFTHETLTNLARLKGIGLNDIELRDPPELQVPEA